jgi:hypothetical protein
MPGLRLERVAASCQPRLFCRYGRQSSRRERGRPPGGKQIVSFRDLLHSYPARTFSIILKTLAQIACSEGSQ